VQQRFDLPTQSVGLLAQPLDLVGGLLRHYHLLAFRAVTGNNLSMKCPQSLNNVAHDRRIV